MCCYHFILRQSCFQLQAVNVLCEDHLQHTFELHEPLEIVGGSWIIFIPVQFLTEIIEDLRFIEEGLQTENFCGIIHIIFPLESCIKPCLWRSEIWDTSTDTDASTCHECDLLVLSLLHVLNEHISGQVLFLLLLLSLRCSILIKGKPIYFVDKVDDLILLSSLSFSELLVIEVGVDIMELG